jgi:hypothetical protein
MKLSKDFYRSMDFSDGMAIKKIPMREKRKSRKLATISYVGRYADGSLCALHREVRSDVHKCR